MKTRYEEYLICKERGHAPPSTVTASIPPQNVCSRCGTYYWYERVLHEHSQPEPDDLEEK